MTTLASSFKYGGFSVVTPVGTIVSYLGTSDPEGWIICDGTQRNNGNGRYKELKDILNSALGVATNTQDIVTPPDLRSRFLYGKSVSTITSSLAGSSTVTIGIDNIPSHKHNVTASQGTHTHNITDPTHTHVVNNTPTKIFELYDTDGTNNETGGNGNSSGATPTLSNSSTGITINNASAGAITVTESNIGGGTALSLPVPPHFTVNYIIKY